MKPLCLPASPKGACKPSSALNAPAEHSGGGDWGGEQPRRPGALKATLYLFPHCQSLGFCDLEKPGLGRGSVLPVSPLPPGGPGRGCTLQEHSTAQGANGRRCWAPGFPLLTAGSLRHSVTSLPQCRISEFLFWRGISCLLSFGRAEALRERLPRFKSSSTSYEPRGLGMPVHFLCLSFLICNMG